MEITQSDSAFSLMIEKAIHKNIITRHEFQKIKTLSGQDLKIDGHEKKLLCHLQGLMGNGSTNKVQRQ